MTILVLGMHRSGTSAITNMIRQMGAHTGPESLMLEASADNPLGFWERKDVLAINRAILQSQHCNWHHIDGFDSRRPLPAMLHAQMQALQAEWREHAPALVKDPRFCLTMPYWRPYLAQPVIVLALRHPAAIAHSLQLRNQFPVEQSLALWEGYMRHLLPHLEALPVIRCHFEEIIAQPEESLRALYEALRPHAPALKPLATHTLHPELIHTPPAPIPLTRKQQQLYEEMGERNIYSKEHFLVK